MTLSSDPLRGTELVDCARANRDKDIETVAQRCGYSQIDAFEHELKQACDALGIEIQGFGDFIALPDRPHHSTGIEVAPESPTQL